MSNKILILPDIHNRWELAEKTINEIKPSKTIFLGDYFDDFNDTPQDISETAEWFKHSVHQENRIHLVGNHDTHYWFTTNKFLRCSGYEQYKSITINDILKKKIGKSLFSFITLTINGC
jgi:metallophosphoesterase superfamily enzyme